MRNLSRQVYILSDLHLGGDYPSPGRAGTRGFRLCTHAGDVAMFVEALSRRDAAGSKVELILNGDTVDFLAERSEAPSKWSPFVGDPASATERLDAIARRDETVFAALSELLRRGHRLVLTLGNHDVELCLPGVRQRLRSLLGAVAGADFDFVYDGEAYVLGDALIEHGNRYDPFNVVNFNALTRYRGLLSRGQPVRKAHRFRPPAGSRIVASVVNPIKETYPFVDLLKPETGAMVPFLLALEPGARRHLGSAARFAARAWWDRAAGAVFPTWRVDVASGPDGADASSQEPDGECNPPASPDSAEALDWVVRRYLGVAADELLAGLGERPAGPSAGRGHRVDVAANDAVERLGRFACGANGLAALLFKGHHRRVEKRLPALLELRALQREGDFETGRETAPEYLQAADALAVDGIKYVMFGHTHLPKHVDLGRGRAYLNSGTWADVLRFDREMLDGPDAMAFERLRAFVGELKTGDYSRWKLFRPTFVRLDFDQSGKVAEAVLCEGKTP